MPTTSEIIDSLNASATRADTSSRQLYDVANGPASGPGSTVSTDGGEVPTVARFLADNQAAIDSTPTGATVIARLADPSQGDNIIASRLGVAGAVTRDVRERLDDHPSVLDFGAVGDGAASSAAAFAAMEADAAHAAFYVPEGVYRCGTNTLSKRYFGPGSLVFENGGGLGGTAPKDEVTRSTYLGGPNSGAPIGVRSDVIIGDSISEGYGVGQASAYAFLLQKHLNSALTFGQGSFQSGGMLSKLTPAGSIADGTKGPLKLSKIMQPGASLAFTADHIDYVGFWFQKAPGAGSIEIRRGSTLIHTVSCAGAAENDAFSGVSPLIKGTFGEPYSLTCAGAAVELTGVFASHSVGPADSEPCFMQVQARSGHATADFSDDDVIASIKKQTVYTAYFPRYILALGTNDIYNPSKAVTSAVFRQNLESIVTKLGVATSVIRLVVPLRAGNGTFAPVVEPFDNYRRAVYQLARKYALDVIDLSTVDLLSVGAYLPDQLHPNAYGHAILAGVYYRDLYSDITSAPRQQALTLSSGVTLAGAPYSPAYANMGPGGVVFLRGTLNVAGKAKNSVISTIPADFAPTSRRIFNLPTITGGGWATVLIDPNGAVTLFDFGAASITFLSLDGASYYCG